MLPEDEQKLRSQLIEVAAERDQIRSQFEALRNEINPWYRRWQVLLPIAIAALAVAITLFVLLLSRP
jgi:FtsZ-binding cell division protein ZapB